MSRWGRVLLVVAALAAIAGAVSLGNWQARRAEEKLALQAAWDNALQAAPVHVSAADLAAIGARLPLRVRLAGRYLFEHEIWLDNRQMDGRSGLQLLTPLAVDGGRIVLVNRGFAPRDPTDRSRLPQVARPSGPISVEGLALAQTSQVRAIGENAPAKGAAPLWQNLDYEAYERASGLAVARWVVRQSDGEADGLLRNWPRISTGAEKNRGYALQWYGLAALIAVLTAWFGWRALRHEAGTSDTRE